jgi:hypothetical protein
MSRRSGAPAKDEMTPFTETLEDQSLMSRDVESQSAAESSTMDPLSVDGREQAKKERIQEWKNGPFAAGMVRTWEEERAKYSGAMMQELASGNDDSMPCICCSAFACSKIGAGRIG